MRARFESRGRGSFGLSRRYGSTRELSLSCMQAAVVVNEMPLESHVCERESFDLFS